MGFVGKMLENRVSDALGDALGLRVTFDKLDVSLAGTVDARNVAIFAGAAGGALDGAGEGDGAAVTSRPADLPPLLLIERVKAQLAVTRALKGEIVVRSIVVSRPVIDVVMGPPGRGNVPAKLLGGGGAAAEAEEAPTGDDAAPEAAKRGKRWQFDVEKVLIADGRLRFRRVDADGGTAADFSAETFAAEFGGGAGAGAASASAPAAEQDGHPASTRPFTLILGSFRAGDRPLELGDVRVSGRLTNAENLAEAAEAGLQADIDVAGLLQVSVNTDSLARRRVQVSADGSAEVARLLASLAAVMGAPVGPLAWLDPSGRIDLSLRGEASAEDGLHVGELIFRAKDVRARPPPAGRPAGQVKTNRL